MRLNKTARDLVALASLRSRLEVVGTRKNERACLPLARPFFFGPATHMTSDRSGEGGGGEKEKEKKREQ